MVNHPNRGLTPAVRATLKTLDDLYSEDLRLEGEIAKIRRQQAELKQMIEAKEAEIAARRNRGA